VRLEPPEPRRLLQRQLQAWHLDELGADAGKQRIALNATQGGAANDLHALAAFQESRQAIAQPLSLALFTRQSRN
jgi:hypothetical protein